MNSACAPALIEAEGVCKIYRAGRVDVPALRGVDLRAGRGEFLAIVGPSGCGKSTLLHVLGGLATPTTGSVRIGGREVHGLSDGELARLRAKTIGFVFQRFNLIPTLTVRGNIALAQKLRGAGTGGIDEMLQRVGLGGKERRTPAELSIGEQQRAAIARAVIHRPALLFADEPTGNLDSANSAAVIEIFRSMHREFNQTVLLVTHNAEIAAGADRIIAMKDGRIV